jgi:hypothetical protein
MLFRLHADWRVVDVDDGRQSDLQATFNIMDLADRITAESSAIAYRKERGSREAKGSWRPTFTIDLPPELFDRFFNNPCGYRGQFLASPELGTSVNLQLLESIGPRLKAAVPETTAELQSIEASLASPAAKVWMDEDQHDPRTPDLRVQIQVPSWVAAAEIAHARLKAADSTLTPKETDRIYGVRAPAGTRLKVFGAWVGAHGVQPVVPSKQRRAFEIHAFGVS